MSRRKKPTDPTIPDAGFEDFTSPLAEEDTKPINSHEVPLVTQVVEAPAPPTPEIEILAATMHDVWARWAKYFIESCSTNSNGQLILPANRVAIWKRQMETPYQYLTEADKERDRKIAREVLEVIK